MTKRVALYLRVSTGEQTTANQRLELEAWAVRCGHTVTEVYEDHAISGAKGWKKRPAVHRLCKDCSQGKLDLVAAWSIDRLGRSLHHVVTFMAALGEQGVGIDDNEADSSAVTVDTGGAGSAKEKNPFNSTNSQYAIVRVRSNFKKDYRVVSGIKIGVGGKVTPKRLSLA